MAHAVHLVGRPEATPMRSAGPEIQAQIPALSRWVRTAAPASVGAPQDWAVTGLRSVTRRPSWEPAVHTGGACSGFNGASPSCPSVQSSGHLDRSHSWDRCFGRSLLRIILCQPTFLGASRTPRSREGGPTAGPPSLDRRSDSWCCGQTIGLRPPTLGPNTSAVTGTRRMCQNPKAESTIMSPASTNEMMDATRAMVPNVPNP